MILSQILTNLIAELGFTDQLTEFNPVITNKINTAISDAEQLLSQVESDKLKALFSTNLSEERDIKIPNLKKLLSLKIDGQNIPQAKSFSQDQEYMILDDTVKLNKSASGKVEALYLKKLERLTDSTSSIDPDLVEFIKAHVKYNQYVDEGRQNIEHYRQSLKEQKFYLQSQIDMNQPSAFSLDTSFYGDHL